MKVLLSNKNNICILVKTLNLFLLRMFMRKLRMEQKIKGFTYFNKTSKESKLRIKVIGNSRWSIPVTDLVKPS